MHGNVVPVRIGNKEDSVKETGCMLAQSNAGLLSWPLTSAQPCATSTARKTRREPSNKEKLLSNPNCFQKGRTTVTSPSQQKRLPLIAWRDAKAIAIVEQNEEKPYRIYFACWMWFLKQARGLMKTASEIRSSLKCHYELGKQQSRWRVEERSRHWDALLPFSGVKPAQQRDQKYSHGGGVTAGRHMILNTGLPEWRISLLEEIHIKSRRSCGIVACRSFYGIITCSCLRKLI